MTTEIISLNKKIINCNKCKRLILFRKKLLKKKGSNILMRTIGVDRLLDLVKLTVKFYLLD